jgi:hypothetical protein
VFRSGLDLAAVVFGEQLLDDAALHLVQLGHPKRCRAMKQILGLWGANCLERP